MSIKVLLITPDANMHKLIIGSHVRSFREAPLSLTTLAALTGDDPDIAYTLVDESVDPVPLDFPADLVAISVITGTSRRGYALADHFRGRGIPVVLGGVHVTAMPKEARPFADCLVIGMAEETWPELILDFKAGRLKDEYRGEEKEGEFAENLPTPRWDLLRQSGYMLPYTIQFTRGCMHACDFCMVPVIWKRFQRRPVADIIRDVKAIPSRRFAVTDVSPFEDIEWAKELCTALIPLKKTWGALATTRITDDPELFDLLAKAGCSYLLIGFETVEQEVLTDIAKGFNRVVHYDGLMRQLHDANIVVQGTFVFGFDHDTPDVFANTVERIQALKIDIPRYSIYTPYPGTRLFQRLEEEGRLLSYDWGDYDTMHVVYRPKNMSPVELYEGFRWAYRETFRLNRILRRTLVSGRNFPMTFIGNLAYKIFVKRLYRQKNYEMPVTVRGPDQVVERSADRMPRTNTGTE
ncbi:B12-binding domain-containing radical SAM protein [Thermodesulfobacteriota bacterium]